MGSCSKSVCVNIRVCEYMNVGKIETVCEDVCAGVGV